MNFRYASVTAMFVALPLVACGDDEGSGGAGGDTTTTSSATTVATTTGTTTATTSTGMMGDTGQLRVAHVSPGSPAVDVCLLPSGGAAPIGPVLKSLGDVDGLAFGEVTPYLDLPVDTYGARIVAPNAADCASALAGLPDVTGVAVAANAAYTAAATGVLIDPEQGDAPFSVELYADSLSVAAGKISLRFIHASPDTPPVDVGLGSGNAFTPIWNAVAFPNVGQVGGMDYVETDPLTDATISARATGTTADALVINGLTIPANSVVTAFAIGNLDGSPDPLKVLACFDTSATCVQLP